MGLRRALNLLLLICILPVAYTGSLQSGLKVTLRRIDDEESRLNPHERFLAGVERSKKRARYLASSSNSPAETRIHPTGQFLAEVELGTPPVRFNALADLGSDLVWFQCRPCSPCLNESIAIFDPSQSSSYSTVTCDTTMCNYIGHDCATNTPCAYKYTYAVSTTSGVLSNEKFTFGGTEFKNITFGCGQVNEKFGLVGGGFVGLGRGPLSMVRQLGLQLGATSFSYCLPSVDAPFTTTGPMVFGSAASFSGAQSIPLPPNPASPTYWYLPIIGFNVAGTMVPIPSGTFAIQPNGSGGMIIDTGATILLIFKAAYDPLVEALKSATKFTPVNAKAETGSDLCYSTSTPDLKVAPLSFVFNGGAQLELPQENYFVKVGPQDEWLCFAAAVTPESFSVMGNIAQQNIHFYFDIDSFTFAFQHAQCDTL